MIEPSQQAAIASAKVFGAEGNPLGQRYWSLALGELGAFLLMMLPLYRTHHSKCEGD